MANYIRIRKNTAAGAAANNAILANGEPGFETDTGVFKIGDGVTAWNDLDPISGGGGTSLFAGLTDDPRDNAALEAELIALEDGLNTKLDLFLTTKPKTASHTLNGDDLADVNSGKEVVFTMDSFTDVTFTLPEDSTHDFPLDKPMGIRRLGVGRVRFVGAGSVAITATNGTLIDPGQYMTYYFQKVGENEWLITNGVPNAVISRVTLYRAGASGHTSSNQPNSERLAGGISQVSLCRFDATNFTKVRCLVRIQTASASANSPRAYIKYSLDGGTNFTMIGDGSVASGAAASYGNVSFSNSSNWMDIPEEARGDFLWGMYENGGNGSASPVLNDLALEFM